MSGFYYLGSPYSKYPDGIAVAFLRACEAAGLLMKAGVAVFSPIAHSHSIASLCEMDHCDHTIWLPADKPLMDAAKGMIVLKLAGWEDSVGLTYELMEFTSAGKPIVFMTPGEVPEELLREVDAGTGAGQ